MKKIFILILFLFTSLLYLFSPDRISANSVPLLGTTHTHYVFPNGSMDNGAIVQTYASPGVRDQVKTQLSQMKNAGVQTLDLVVWHMREAPQPWGVISSIGGRISDPYRTNLINYLTDIKQTGFSRLLITFGPQWKNQPATCDGYGQYDPARFEENWKFIQDIRSIAKQYGPQYIIFDLLGEGAPNDYWSCHQQVYDYDVSMWQRYVNTYGNSDAMISFIAVPNTETDNNGHLLENLISIYKTAGVGFPNWFYFSFYINDNPDQNTAYNSLVHIDKVLSDNGLSQVLRIRETYYNNQNTGNAIKQFNGSHSRQVDEVIQWYKTPNDPARNISPPYNVDVYKSIFGGSSSGSISARPNPCIAQDGKYCISTLSWQTANTNNVAILRLPNPMSDYYIFSQGIPSGTKNTDFQTVYWPDTLVLYANYNTSLTPQQNISSGNLQELARVILTAVQPPSIPILSPSPSPTGNPSPTGIVPSRTPSASPSFIPGDLDKNGKVDIYDYNILVSNFGKTGSNTADINSDGKVDIFDYDILVENFGKS